jgi:hypothetical protein
MEEIGIISQNRYIEEYMDQSPLKMQEKKSIVGQKIA